MSDDAVVCEMCSASFDTVRECSTHQFHADHAVDSVAVREVIAT